MSKWTRFHDLCSGGSQKEKFAVCIIEAPEEEAKIIFYNRFGHSPERVTCTCCGKDYCTEEYNSWEDVLKSLFVQCHYEISSEKLYIIKSEDIKPEERLGDLPKQGYIWID